MSVIEIRYSYFMVMIPLHMTQNNGHVQVEFDYEPEMTPSFFAWNFLLLLRAFSYVVSFSSYIFMPTHKHAAEH
jgi:hypothetical protein